MQIDYNYIKDIKFPVYALPPHYDIDFEDGLVLLGDLVLDDKNQPYGTLGARRLHSGQKLVGLSRVSFNVRQMLQSTANKFIDNEGKIFKYVKSQFEKVHYHKIIKVSPRDTETVIKLANVNFPFIVPIPPRPGVSWAGVLYFKGMPWILYDYSEEYHKPLRRKV